MKPRITFVAGSDVLSTNNRDFSELPPINQELEFRGEQYKVVGYREATVELEPIPEVEEESAPRRAKKSPSDKRKAKRQATVAKKSARAEKSKAKTAGNGKTEATKVTGNFYNRKGN